MPAGLSGERALQCDENRRIRGSHAMTANPIEQLEIYGPDRCETMSVEQARAYCRRLATGRYENFSVLSRLVPRDLRDHVAAVYDFCRWADDLGDENGEGPLA